VPHPLQNDPSTAPLQRVEPGAGTSQVPSVAPAAMLQIPPQQSPPRTHASPVWMQYEPPSAQCPPVQRCEQHWSFVEHVLPAVRQVTLSGTHVVPLHVPLQHVAEPASFEQLCPSETHWAAAQKPLAQLSEQQSVGALHCVPCAEHRPTTEVHVLVLGSQTPVQQVEPFVHGSLKTPHDTEPSGGASLVLEASPPAAPPVPTPPPVPLVPPVPPTETSPVVPSPFDPSGSAPPAPVFIAPPAPVLVPDVVVPRLPPAPPASADASLVSPPWPEMGIAASSPPQAAVATAKRSPTPRSFRIFIARPPSGSWRARLASRAPRLRQARLLITAKGRKG
jgi:hypothetical protein